MPRQQHHHRLAVATLLCGLAQSALGAPPQALAEFPPDFKPPLDAELGYPLGGFGGASGQTPSHVPVIFVHGNVSDACGWKLVRDDFRAAGWNDQSLWALSYNGVGSGAANNTARSDPRCPAEQAAQGGTGERYITGNALNVPDLYAFIRAVRDYTGSDQFSLVAHSLGVTLARATLHQHPWLRDDLVAFVGIAGGNDGTSLCPPGAEKVVPVCGEISAGGSAWLSELNGPDGRDETWWGSAFMTIYDGGGTADYAFAGELADSPALKGADNRTFPGTTHNDLRVREDIVATYREFLEAASTQALAIERRRARLIGK